MTTRFVLVGVLSCLAPALASAARAAPQGAPAAAPARGVTVLVFPFENASRVAKLDWLSEGLAELTIERLFGQGPFFYPREERLAALDHLGLPTSTHFSRATMLKIADDIDADYIVFGQYTVDGKALRIGARVLRIGPADLSPPMEESGPLEDLMSTHARLAWRVLVAVGPTLAGTGSDPGREFAAKLARLRLDAFEYYIRGILSADDDERLRQLREAARIEPAWDAPAFAAGETYFARRDCAAALLWLSRIPPANARGTEASFDAGVCHLLRNDPARAEAALASLLERRQNLPEALNNLAVAHERLGKPREAATELERATQLDPEEGEYWFNLGLASLRASDPTAAVRAFREGLRRRPDDAEAHGLLVAALEQSGRSSEAAMERQQSGRGALPLASRQAMAKLGRIKMRLDPASLHPFGEPGGQAAAEGGAKSGEPLLHRMQHRELHMQRGQQYLTAGKLYDAQREFSEAIILAPMHSPAAHQGLAEVFRRQGRSDDAIREMRAALASRDLPATRTALAQLLLELNRTSEAREELRAALKLDPGYTPARQLLERLETRKPPGESP
ncbi:MAG TPA: tetratricopeptide repeat protein [Candidatus Acidoferrales bacterium]|nr:tetratricopeptide repeat protein [Candidatus Acidoferrales bacterium]